ncbi:hypothetical protein ACOMHN_047200 [Nucella lapillus]
MIVVTNFKITLRTLPGVLYQSRSFSTSRHLKVYIQQIRMVSSDFTLLWGVIALTGAGVCAAQASECSGKKDKYSCQPNQVCGKELEYKLPGSDCLATTRTYFCKCPGNQDCPIDHEHAFYYDSEYRRYTCEKRCDFKACGANEYARSENTTLRKQIFNCRCRNHGSEGKSTDEKRTRPDQKARPAHRWQQPKTKNYICNGLVPADNDPCN